jgi:transposase
MIPPAKRGGRPREVLNAIFYVLSTGCQWQALPKDLPPKSTAHYYFTLWDWDGTLERLHHALYVATREREGARRAHRRDHRQPERQGGSKGSSALDPQGFDAAKKVTAASGTSWSTRSASC